MIRLLVANGCSLTRGQELRNPESEAWPAVLAKELGVACVNLASDGASNRRIVRTTVASLTAVCAEAGVRPDEVLTAIMWTACVRHEVYVAAPRPGFFRAKRLATSGWENIGPWGLAEAHRPSRAFYDHLWSEEGQVTNLFLDWLLLDRFLQEEGYGVRYAFATPEAPSIPEPAQWFARQLRPESVFGGLPGAAGTSFHEVIGDRTRAAGGHPLADSHALFAQMLATWLTREGAGLQVAR